MAFENLGHVLGKKQFCRVLLINYRSRLSRNKGLASGALAPGTVHVGAQN
jgi:hypothetical protein